RSSGVPSKTLPDVVGGGGAVVSFADGCPTSPLRPVQLAHTKPAVTALTSALKESITTPYSCYPRRIRERAHNSLVGPERLPQPALRQNAFVPDTLVEPYADQGPPPDLDSPFQQVAMRVRVPPVM